jgi:hypothetical protein
VWSQWILVGIVDDQVSNAVIHSGDSVQLIIRFTPATSGLFNASLQIPSDDPDNNPLLVSMSGTGVGDPVPDIALSSSNINFGDVSTGTTADYDGNGGRGLARPRPLPLIQSPIDGTNFMKKLRLGLK